MPKKALFPNMRDDSHSKNCLRGGNRCRQRQDIQSHWDRNMILKYQNVIRHHWFLDLNQEPYKSSDVAAGFKIS